jgi:hypothetical protein
VAETFEQAVAFARVSDAPVATLEGDVLRGAHLVSGGARVEARGILATRREIKELGERTEAERALLAAAADEIARLEGSIAAAAGLLSALLAEQHREEKEIVGHEAQLARAAEEAARLARKADVIALERRRAEEEREAADQRRAEAEENTVRLRQVQQEAEERLAEAQRRLADARETVSGLAASLAEAGAVNAALVERAAALAAEVERLGKDLTPVGAEKAGTKDGTIPAWEGQDVPLQGWSQGKYRGEFWKHKDEKPLFSIDASNVDKYAEKLSPGQVQLLKQTKGYRMDVYPSHRNAGFPDWIEANIRKNAGGASKIGPDGNLEDAVLPGVPFPFPKGGAEAMWNHIVRYQGVGADWPEANIVTSPKPGSSQWIEPHGPQHLFLPWAKKGSNSPKQVNGLLYSIYFSYVSPPALAGQAVFSTYYFNKSNETFYYFPGQRRVRRLPSYSYDSPQIGFENQYTIDDVWVFNGNPDRFDWKIVGKKELYVPYNSFGMYDFRAKLLQLRGR